MILTLNKGWNVEVWNLHQIFVFCFSCSGNILKQTLSEYRYLYFYRWSIILTSSGKRTKKFGRTQGLYSRKRYSSNSKWSAEHEWIHFCHLLVQINLCQKLFFLQNMGRTCCVQKLFWLSETISPGLSLEFPCIELLIQWTICRHIVGKLMQK